MSGKAIQRSIGFSLVGLVVAIAIFAPWLAPYNPNATTVDVLAQPSAAHLFGTDVLGRDVYSRLLFGARASLVIGLCAAAVGMTIGIPAGLVAGYARGKTDLFIVQSVDLIIALPTIIVALVVTAMIGTTIPNLILIIGLIKWPIIARLVRGQVIILREQTFVEAARAVGCSTNRILRKHIMPNILRVVAAQFAITTSQGIFTAASLSFLGLGLPPPAADWGSMVQGGFDYLFVNPLLALAPGGAVTITVMGFHLIGQTYG